MLIEDTITERSCMADYFSKFFDAMTAKYTLKHIEKNISSKFHYGKDRGYAGIDSFSRLRVSRFKHFYLEKVFKHLRHLFPNVVSYNRLVE